MSNEKRKLRSTSSHNSEAKKKKEVTKPSDEKKTSKGVAKPRKNGLQKFTASGATSKCYEEENDCGKCSENMRGSNTNHIKFLNQFQRGFGKLSMLEQIGEQMYLRDLRWCKITSQVETPGLRVTAMQWHPNNPNLLVSGDKLGVVQLYCFKTLPNDSEISDLNNGPKSFCGVGPGGTILAMRFNTKRSGIEVCTASVDGSISAYNFEMEQRTPLVESATPTSLWFCSVDVHSDGKRVIGGDTTGKLAIHHLDSGETKHTLKLHKTKVKHLEFHPRDPNVMVTASLDKTAKLWDIRMLDEKKRHIECLEHDSAVSSATFSQTNGCRLLTTDQYGQIRVYRAPSWALEHKITHPHRHFRHLTDIEASWHPFADLFVVGRYPDPKLADFDQAMRSVDIFSALSGKLRYELMDSSSLITSLSHFNCSGTLLATSTGRKINVWPISNSQTWI